MMPVLFSYVVVGGGVGRAEAGSGTLGGSVKPTLRGSAGGLSTLRGGAAMSAGTVWGQVQRQGQWDQVQGQGREQVQGWGQCRDW
jgi:hypothetical protein